MTRCGICGSEDWWRCFPGTSPGASSLPQALKQAVLAFPGREDVPKMAWCAACDPIIVRSA